MHLKALDQKAAGSVKAALTANGGEPSVEGALDASPAMRHRLFVNLRACGEPAVVRSLVETALSGLPARCLASQLRCFSPAPPRPERRFAGHFGEIAIRAS